MPWLEQAGEDWAAEAVSPQLRRNVVEMGPMAERWLDEVPVRIRSVAAAWHLEVGAPVAKSGHVSVVFAARTSDGVDALLKLTVPHDEARPEAAALRRWDGDGAVRLLRSSDDGFTLLLERCRPGHDLFRLPVDEHVTVLADLFPRLWIEVGDPGPFPDLGDTVSRWESEMASGEAGMGTPEEVLDDAQHWARELRTDMPRRLLHGDLHPNNVLAAEREPWLAIDPKPWVGDPAFDLAQTLVNWIRIGPDERGAATANVARLARDLSSALGSDLERVLRWAVVKAIGWEFSVDEAVALHRAATTLH